jgi:hypothetical protein
MPFQGVAAIGKAKVRERKGEIGMGFSLTVITGIALFGLCVSRLKARRSEKRDVQTLFSSGK